MKKRQIPDYRAVHIAKDDRGVARTPQGYPVAAIVRRFIEEPIPRPILAMFKSRTEIQAALYYATAMPSSSLPIIGEIPIEELFAEIGRRFSALEDRT